MKEDNVFMKMDLDHQFNIGDLFVYEDYNDIGYATKIEGDDIIITWMKSGRLNDTSNETLYTLQGWYKGQYFPVKT